MNDNVNRVENSSRGPLGFSMASNFTFDAFSRPSTSPSLNSAVPETQTNPPFSPVTVPDDASKNYVDYQSITCMPSYIHQSFEELRVAHYDRQRSARSTHRRPPASGSHLPPFKLPDNLFRSTTASDAPTLVPDLKGSQEPRQLGSGPRPSRPASESHNNKSGLFPMQAKEAELPSTHHLPGARSWSPPPQTPRTTTSQDAPEPAQLAGTAYEHTRQKLMEIIGSLQSTGVQREVDLPQIVVIGSQSVGKSSLIESISGITLPRDTGTCTRCPMECRLQKAATWSCQIVLRYHADEHGSPLEHVRECPFGDTIYDPKLVATRVGLAQKAILHPNVPPTAFMGEYAPATKGLSFSYDCVCIRVAGPNIPDLYFYDLPGVIVNVRDGSDQKDIQLVRNIAEQYINKPNSLILLAISCETDFENQGAGHLVLPHHELRARTVGVLTKVDRIEDGTGKKWIDMVLGHENELLNKWFAVKQPTPDELKSGISWERARANEEDFFSKVPPWASVSGDVRKQLGSHSLAEHLGRLLATLISQKLPEIKREIVERLNDVEIQLQSIPPAVIDPYQEVCDLVLALCDDVQRNVRGRWRKDGAPGLVQSLRATYEGFQKAIASTAPRMRPWDPERLRESEENLIKMSERYDDLSDSASGQIFYLNDVKEFASRARTRELPGNTPFDVKESLIQTYVNLWQSRAESCFREADTLMNNHLTSIVSDHFSKFSHTGLHDAVLLGCQTHLQNLGHETQTALANLLDLERVPSTLNTHYFFDYKEKMASAFEQVYHTAMGNNVAKALLASESGQDQIIAEAFALLRKAGLDNLKPRDLIHTQSSQDADVAIDIMAEVRAYFQVAYKRFPDNVALQIDKTLVRKFADGLRSNLMTSLGIYEEGGRDNCARWLREDPIMAEKRKDLEARKRALLMATNKLHSIHI